MSESVILSSPLLLVLYGIALGLTVYDNLKKTGMILPVLSAFIAVGASVYALLSGASLYEVAAAVSIILIVLLAGAWRKKE